MKDLHVELEQMFSTCTDIHPLNYFTNTFMKIYIPRCQIACSEVIIPFSYRKICWHTLNIFRIEKAEECARLNFDTVAVAATMKAYLNSCKVLIAMLLYKPQYEVLRHTLRSRFCLRLYGTRAFVYFH